MTVEQLQDLRHGLISICSEVSLFIRAELDFVSHEDIVSKDRNSLVSYVDQEAERKLVAALSSLLPEAGFITEENTVARDNKALMWVIDPLDGTSNYLYRLPHFSISIALMSDGVTIAGIVYEIMHNRAFSAVKGGGAFENNKSITVSDRNKKSEALVVTGFPYEREVRLDDRLAVLKQVILNYRGLRRLGSAALDLAYVASGRFDIYYENELNVWDIAAGKLLVEEAGGVVKDYRGGDDVLRDCSVVATTPVFYNEFAQLIKKHLS